MPCIRISLFPPAFSQGKEVRESGLKGLSTKSILPYVANAGIAMVMFHTYTTTRLMLYSWADRYPSLACCEALAGASAGLMQATLHSPLYNVRLCRDDEILSWDLPRFTLFHSRE